MRIHTTLQQKRVFQFRYGKEEVSVGVFRRFDKRVQALMDVFENVENFNAAHGLHAQVIRPQIADHLLTQTEKGGYLLVCSSFPTNAGIAYERPGKAFGTEIVFAHEDDPRVILPTGKYAGERGIALLVLGLMAADIRKDGRDIRIAVPDSRLVVFPGFPDRTNLCIAPPDTIVSVYNQRIWGAAAVEIERTKGAYAGLLLRSSGLFDSFKQYTYAFYRAVDRFGVAVEMPATEAAEWEQKISETTKT